MSERERRKKRKKEGRSESHWFPAVSDSTSAKLRGLPRVLLCGLRPHPAAPGLCAPCPLTLLLRAVPVSIEWFEQPVLLSAQLGESDGFLSFSLLFHSKVAVFLGYKTCGSPVVCHRDLFTPVEAKVLRGSFCVIPSLFLASAEMVKRICEPAVGKGIFCPLISSESTSETLAGHALGFPFRAPSPNPRFWFLFASQCFPQFLSSRLHFTVSSKKKPGRTPSS